MLNTSEPSDSQKRAAGAVDSSSTILSTGTAVNLNSLAIVPIQDTSVTPVTSSPAPQPPHTEFPSFEGDNPRLWQKACEKYFRLFSVDRSHRVEYATMHFTGNAAMWLQRVEDKLGIYTWEQLCELLSKHFDRG